MKKDERDRLVREMAACGWTSEISEGKWVLTDPKGESLKSAWPPFVGGFAYGFLRCREEATLKRAARDAKRAGTGTAT